MPCEPGVLGKTEASAWKNSGIFCMGHKFPEMNTQGNAERTIACMTKRVGPSSSEVKQAKELTESEKPAQMSRVAGMFWKELTPCR